jgi:hypothetical protein
VQLLLLLLPPPPPLILLPDPTFSCDVWLTLPCDPYVLCSEPSPPSRPHAATAKTAAAAAAAFNKCPMRLLLCLRFGTVDEAGPAAAAAGDICCKQIV